MKTPAHNIAREAAAIEPLEARISPALITATWLGGDGSWNDPSKWSTGTVPTNGGGNDYHVVLDVPGTVTITVPGSINIHSLSNAEHLDIVGSYYSPTYFHLTGGGVLTNTGTIQLFSDGNDPNRSQLAFDDTTTISGAGDILLTTYPMLSAAAGADVTIGAGQKIHGFGVVNIPSLDNAGTIEADAGLLVVTATGVNTGTLLASGGVLRLFNSSFDNTAGIVKADGGSVDVAGTSLPGGQWIATDNPASHIMLIGNVDADGASWQASGAGDFQVSRTTCTLSGDVSFTGGKFSLVGEFYAPMYFHYAGGTFTNNGSITITSDNNDPNRALFAIDANATFAGVGDVKLIDTPLVTTAPGATLTLDVGQKLHGNGIITGSYVNSGTIEADSAAGPLTLSAPSISNADGTLRANGGRLAVNTGTTITGGALAVTDDAASIIDFSGTIGVDGTTWEGAGAGRFRVNYGATTTLNGSVHLATGELDVLGQYHAPVYLNLGGGTWTNDGLIHLLSDNNAPSRAQIHLNGNVTLNGEGALWLEHTPMISGEAGTQLTIGADQLLHGSGVINVPLLTNAGTITADAGAETLTVSSAGSNTKLMSAIAGTLRFDGANLTNTGATIRAEGATVTLANCAITGGDIVATDDPASRVFLTGTINADATTWRANGAGEFQVDRTTATLNGNVHLASGRFGLIGHFHAPIYFNLGGGTFTNDGRIELVSDNNDPNRAQIHLNADTTFAGAGEIKLINTPMISGEPGAKLTLDTGQTLHGFGIVNVPKLDSAGAIASDVTNQTLVLTSTGANSGLMHASAGTLRFDGSSFANSGATVRADGGIVAIVNSTITGGALVATDDAASRVRFAGAVNANGTTWTASGAGEFQVAYASATLSGDVTLSAGKFSLLGSFGAPLYFHYAGGTFTNNGAIELISDNNDSSRGLFAVDADATLAGGGDLRMANTPLLTTAPGATLTIGAGQKIHGYGLVTGSFTNHGTIEADAGVNPLQLNGASVANTGGTLRAAGGRLAVNNTTTITGGALAVTDDAASVIDFTGTIGVDGTTWSGAGAGRFRVNHDSATLSGSVHLAAGELDLLGSFGAPVYLTLGGGTWTNDGIIKLVSDNNAPSRAQIILGSNVTLDGAGELRLVNTPLVSGAPGTELTIGAGQTVHGFGYIAVPTVRNAGRICVDATGDTLVVQSDVINSGELVAIGGIYGRALVMNGHVTLTGDGTLGGDAMGLITFAHDITGDTSGGVRVEGAPNVRFDGPSSAGAPQWIELMDRDLGFTPAGFAGAYGYRAIDLNGGAYLKLQDAADNATGAEALYIDTLTVPGGTTIDVTGQHIYVRTANLWGTVVGDAGAPVSSVTALPANWLGSDLNVQWSGLDDAGGTGLAAFDIFVSDNGGAFTLWLDDTTATSAQFAAEDGHTYAFYSVARDNLGFVEVAPAIADTTTEIHFLAITSAPVGAVNEDASYGYDAASNADALAGAGLVWSLVNPPAQLTIDAATGAVSGLFDNAAVGDHALTLRVDDNQGHHATQSFTLHVANVAGTFVAPTPAAAQLGQPFTLDLDSTDEGHGAVTYSIVSAPAWLNVNAATGVLSGTPAHRADLGAPNVTMRVDDGHGGTDETTFALNVAGQVITLDPALRQTRATFTDADGDLVTVSLTGKTGRVHLLRSLGSGATNTTAGDLFGIELDGTGLANALTFTVKPNKAAHAGDGHSTIGEVIGSGSLGALKAGALHLIGDVSLPGGTIAALTLHDVKNGADVTLGGAQAPKGVSFTAQTIEAGSALAFGSPLATFKVLDWAAGTLTAPSAGSLLATNGFDANVTLGGALKLLKANTWSGALMAASAAKLSIAGDANADLTLTDPLAKLALGSATVGGSLTGAYWEVAGAAGSITVARDLDSATLDLQAKVAAITVRGTARDSLVRSGGDIAKITLGASERSDFGAGIALAELQSSRHAGDASGPPTAKINTFTVSGLKVAKGAPVPRFFSDSNVSAKLGTMSLHNWDGVSGVWAPTGMIKKITHHDTALKDAEHNWVYPEPARQVSGQPELFVHLL